MAFFKSLVIAVMVGCLAAAVVLATSYSVAGMWSLEWANQAYLFQVVILGMLVGIVFTIFYFSKI